MTQVRLKEELSRVKEVGNLFIHFFGDDENIELLLRTVISVNQLSIYGAVADMCEQALLMFQEEVREQPDMQVPTSEVISVTNSLPTNDHARGSALLEYKRMIENLIDDLRIDKMSSEAGFVQTVAIGQYFMTLGDVGFVQSVAIGQYFMTICDTELARLEGPIACREYTLPRNEDSKTAEGWIRENTRIGLVLEVAVCYHQSCYGIEIRIESLSGDQIHSWVKISTGMNKYVMEMTKIVPSPRTTDRACTGEPVARFRPNQTSLKSSSSRSKVKTDKPIHARKWIDVEPGEYDTYSYDDSKKMIQLLRDELPQRREEDGAIAFKFLAQMFVSQFESSPYWSIQSWVNHLERGGGAKKRFQYCVNPDSPGVLIYFRAIQGHSGATQIDPSL